MENTTWKNFAEQVNTARIRQHLSISSVARMAEVPKATAQGWLSGLHSPTPALRKQYLKLVRELGLNEEVPSALWLDDWTQIEPRLRSGAAPYHGLRQFAIKDADHYFGREQEARRLGQFVADRRNADGFGIVALMGASGSGKSSLLAAGLAGRECVDGTLAGCTYRFLTPETLADPVDGIDLVIIDQFEDALAFDDVSLAALGAQVAELAERVTVILGIRSDGFARFSQLPELALALSRPVLLAPMTRDEVRDVIEAPAKQAGLSVEPELTNAVLSDLAPGGAAGPVPLDVLPLLSSALLLTWAAGEGDRMTVADYYRGGGIASAVESLAEEVYASLDESQQERARTLLLRLIRQVNNTVVREPLRVDQLDAGDRTVMDAFIVARMMTVTGERVQISHDALLTAWPRLRDWITDSQDELHVREQLSRAARLWIDNERAPESLIPVDRLPLFAELIDDPARQRLLTVDERDFLTSSRAHFTSQLDAERETTTTLRRRGRLLIMLTATAVALALIAGFAFIRGTQFEKDAQSRQVALQAQSLRSLDANLQAQMALVASGITTTREGTSALLTATATDLPTRWSGVGSAVLGISPDQETLVRASADGSITLWRKGEWATGPGTSAQVDPKKRPLYTAALHPVNGRLLLAVGGGGGYAELWDVTASPTRVAELGVGDLTTYALGFDVDGTTLAAGRSDGSVQIFDLSVPESPQVVHTLAINGPVSGVVFDPKQPRLFVSGGTDHLAVWRISGKQAEALPDLTYTASVKNVRSLHLAVSPDGRWLAAALAGSSVPRWDLATAQPTPVAAVEGFGNWVNSVSFSPDSTRLIAGDSSQKVTIADAATGATLRTIAGPTLVTSVGYLGSAPVATGVDGTLRVWLGNSRLLRESGATVYQLATDGTTKRWLAAVAPNGHELMLWDIRTPQFRRLPDPVIPAGVEPSSGIVISADGRWLIGGSRTGVVVAWPLTDAGAGTPKVSKLFDQGYLASVALNPAGTTLAAAVYTGEETAIASFADGVATPVTRIKTPVPQVVTFNEDGSLLQVGLGGNAVQLWSMADAAQPSLAATIATDNTAAASAFAPHDPLLAIGTDSGEVTVWDVSTPTAPRRKAAFHDARSGIYTVLISPDGRKVYAGGGDEVFWGWDLQHPDAGAFIALDGQLGRTTEGRLVHDGSILVGTGTTGGIKLWTTDTAAAKADLCQRRGDQLTDEEWVRYLHGIQPFAIC